MKITTLYFSAAYTTKRVVEAVAANLSNVVTTYDITNDAPTEEVAIPADELVGNAFSDGKKLLSLC